MSHRRKNVSVARVVYNGLSLQNIVVPHLLQRDEQSIGAFVDLIQGLRESWEAFYRNFARLSPCTIDWLLELIKCIITRQHTVLLW